MRWEDRKARLEYVKRLGRLAYGLMIDAKIQGIATIDGEDKFIREYACTRDRLRVFYYAAFRAQSDEEFSWIIVRYDGRKVFDFRWNKAGAFRTVTFDEEGDEWERALRKESEASYF